MNFRGFLAVSGLLIGLLIHVGSASGQGVFRFPLEPTGVPVGSSSDSLFGFVTSNRTLTTAAPGPVWHVIGDLYIQSGVTLTIEPGVTLLFDSNSDLLNSGYYYDKSELIVSGSLLANGAAADSIRFQSTSGLTSSWGHIGIEPSGTISMNFCVLRDADVGVYSNSSAFYGSGNRVSNGAVGILSYASSITVNGWHFDHLSTGVQISGTGVRVTKCEFRPPLQTGLLIASGGASPYVRVDHSVFVGNNFGITDQRVNCPDMLINYCTFDGNVRSLYQVYSTNCVPPRYVRNSILTNSPEGATSPYGNWHFDYCDLWNCPWGISALDSGIVVINPLYVNPATYDFRLKTFSPLRTMGEGGTQMGAYGAGGNVSGVPADPAQATPIKWITSSPNPFSRDTSLQIGLSRQSDVKIDIVDIRGQLVRSLFRAEMEAGNGSVGWDGRNASGSDVPSGLYFWRAVASGHEVAGRLLKAK